MFRKKIPRPTDAELEILQALWTLGPSTVREVNETLSEKRKLGYTTVLKTLQIMTEKKLVERDERRRTHIYRARRDAEETQRQLVGDLLDRAFGGSAQALVLRALEAKPASEAERAEIRRLLDKMEGGTQDERD